MSDELTRLLAPIRIPESLVEAIDDYRFANRIPTQAAAVRELIRRGLEASDRERAREGHGG